VTHIGGFDGGEEIGSTSSQPAASGPNELSGPSADLISAISGRQADRERLVARKTRGVILSSLGVLQERKVEKRRARAVAIAVTVVVLLLLAPLLWEFTDSVLEGEHLSDPGSQLSIWAFVVCGTLLGAALVAGWWRKRQ